MGAEPYWYFTKYRRNLNDALQELRDREFRAGRYNPVMPFVRFPVDPESPGPGAQHDSIQAAVKDAGADGTRSILDLMTVGDGPDFCVAAHLPDGELLDLYGTAQPTRAMIESNMPFSDDLERGHGVYIIVYKDGQPDEIFFGGYSFD
jgi:hypothetical protein